MGDNQVTTDKILSAALNYAERGWRVFPVRNKQPIVARGLLSGSTDREIVLKYFQKARPGVGIGITAGKISGLVVLDIDIYKPGVQESYDALKKLPGYTHNTVIAVTGRKGLQYYFKYPERGGVTNSQGLMGLVGIDVRGEGGYVVAPPSPHESGEEYRWLEGHSPDDIELAPCPEFIIKARPPQTEQTHSIQVALGGVAISEDGSDGTTPIPEGERNSTLTAIAGTLRNFGLSADAIFVSLMGVNFSRCVPPLPETEVRVIADHIVAYPPRRNRTTPVQGVSTPELAQRMLTFDRNDSGFGEMLAFYHSARLRYNHTRALWLTWVKHFWVPDEHNEVYMLAVEVADRFKNFAAQIQDENQRSDALKYARRMKDKAKLDAAIFLAAAQPGIATVHSEWDNTPNVVATLSGIVDLSNGSVRPGQPDDKISQWVNLEYNPKAKAPRWEAFLGEIFNEDKAVISFVQKAVGYSLTGENKEQCFFLLVGRGANGKTTFLEILRLIFGSYAFSAPFATFERHPGSAPQTNDLAALANKRFVMAAEPKEGAILDEGRIKSLTGGEQISARFLHREFFQFVPVCKIWLASNTLPRIMDDTYGFWRRARMIKFLQQFVDPSEIQSPNQKPKDPDLLFKLMLELPGIFNWVIEGAQKWYLEGLSVPNTVASATEQYRTDSDPLHDFFTQHCISDPDTSVIVDELYRAYVMYCQERLMKPFEIISATRFKARLSREYSTKTIGGVPYYIGISIAESSRRLTSPGLQSVTINFGRETSNVDSKL